MNILERLWVGTSDGYIFEIGYHTFTKLAEEKLLDRAINVPCWVEAKSDIIQRFYPSRRGVIIQLVQHPFYGEITACGFGPLRTCWYTWTA
jgi:hypothetical protein